jgi:hypothetical protein
MNSVLARVSEFARLRRDRLLTRPPAWTLAFLLLGVLALGCGHPASVKECEEIADRVTELELSSSPVGRDPDTAKEQLERTRSWVKESQLKSCVGRRITDTAMKCVRAAKKAQDITDRCFR